MVLIPYYGSTSTSEVLQTEEVGVVLCRSAFGFLCSGSGETKDSRLGADTDTLYHVLCLNCSSLAAPSKSLFAYVGGVGAVAINPGLPADVLRVTANLVCSCDAGGVLFCQPSSDESVWLSRFTNSFGSLIGVVSVVV